MKLKDGKSVKVSPDEAKMFNAVLKELNPENRKRMEMEMMKDQGSYKRMLIFAPNKDPWPTIAETCDEVFMIESQAGKGLVDKHWDEILKGIVNSV